MLFIQNRAISYRILFTSMAALLIMLTISSSAFAKKDCGFFSVTIGEKTYTAAGGDIRLVLPAAEVSGQTAQVKGTFVEFDVDLDTFTVTDYTLTGAPSSSDVTGGKRTRVFVSQTPQLTSDLTGNLELRLSRERIKLTRAGRGAKMKVDASDCTQGDIFDIESDFAIKVVHVLDPAFRYYTDAAGRTLFTNGKVIGREGPDLATLISRTTKTSQWQLNRGGNVDAVFGQDAVRVIPQPPTREQQRPEPPTKEQEKPAPPTREQQ